MDSALAGLRQALVSVHRDAEEQDCAHLPV